MPENYPKRVLRLRKQQAAVTSPDDIEFGPVPIGEQWYANSVCAVDLDNNVDRVGIIIRDGQALYWVHDIVDASDGIRYSKSVSLWLKEGEYLILRFVGATATDDLRAYVVGHIEEVFDGLKPLD